MKYIKGFLAIFFMIIFFMASGISYLFVCVDQLLAKAIRYLIKPSK